MRSLVKPQKWWLLSCVDRVHKSGFGMFWFSFHPTLLVQFSLQSSLGHFATSKPTRSAKAVCSDPRASSGHLLRLVTVWTFLTTKSKNIESEPKKYGYLKNRNQKLFTNASVSGNSESGSEDYR